jgi:hypothetical protein
MGFYEFHILAMGFKVELGGGFSKPIKKTNKTHQKTLNPNCLNRGVDGMPVLVLLVLQQIPDR